MGFIFLETYIFVYRVLRAGCVCTQNLAEVVTAWLAKESAATFLEAFAAVVNAAATRTVCAYAALAAAAAAAAAAAVA